MTFKRFLTPFFAFALCAGTTGAQHAKIHQEYREHRYQGITYGLFVPANLDPKISYPLIVYLHGRGDTVSHDHQWYEASLQRQHPSFIITPKCLNADGQGWGTTWGDKHPAVTATTLSLVDSLAAVQPIDKSRLYLYGISMGGFGTFSILQKNPGKFAAAFAICGGSDIKAARSLLNTPLWIFHGDADDVVPVRLSRDMYNEMVSLGGKLVKYTEYPDVKHNSWEIALREPRLVEWLFSKKLR